MADSFVENLSSSSVTVQQQPQPQQQPSTSHISVVNLNQILTAEIRVENNNNTISSQPSPPPPPIQQQQQSSSSSAGAGVALESDDALYNNNNIMNMNKRREEDANETDEPQNKRQKVDNKNNVSEKLEVRLSGILCCAVCLDLPKHSIYQCTLGHLMCAACFTHLLADGRLKDVVATCPTCRLEISKSNTIRILAVEKAISELPGECQYCEKQFPRRALERHEEIECDERPTDCKYAVIGCKWRGPIHENKEHEESCAHPKKSGADVMNSLKERDAKHLEETKLFRTLLELLNYEKIIFNDLQMKPYRTDEYVHKLFYESSRFTAFNTQWVVKAIINNSQRDPHQSNDRNITYQLILKQKTAYPLSIHYFVLEGPFANMNVKTLIYKHDFTDQENESQYNLLPVADSAECNRLLSEKAINFRLIMFLASK